MIGLHRMMIATFLIRYYNGLVLLFVRMGRPRSPGAEARGRSLSSSSSSSSMTTWEERLNVCCGRWPSSSRPASTTTTRVHVLGIDLPPCPPPPPPSPTLPASPPPPAPPPPPPASLSSYRSSAHIRHRRPWTTTRGAVVVVAEAAAAAALPPCFIPTLIVPLPPAPSPMSPSFCLLKSTCGGRGRGEERKGGEMKTKMKTKTMARLR
jgi:hypothetical protein